MACFEDKHLSRRQMIGGEVRLTDSQKSLGSTFDFDVSTRTVDTHVMFLRQKLCESLIETVRSVGYKFKPA